MGYEIYLWAGITFEDEVNLTKHYFAELGIDLCKPDYEGRLYALMHNKKLESKQTDYCHTINGGEKRLGKDGYGVRPILVPIDLVIEILQEELDKSYFWRYDTAIKMLIDLKEKYVDVSKYKKTRGVCWLMGH